MRLRQSSTVIRAMDLSGKYLALAAAARAYDLPERRLGSIEVFVNYTIFELSGVRHFFLGVGEAALDHSLRILAPAAQAALELLDRGRQDEDPDAVRVELAHLRRALPVDLEHQVLPALQGLGDDLAGGAVAVAVHQRVLEKLAAIAHREERRLVDEVVLAPVLLAGARRACGVGSRELEARLGREERLGKRGLAGARGRSDDEKPSFHSMF